MYDLGFNYFKDFTLFKIFAPDVSDMKVLLYDNYDDVRYKSFEMTKDEDGYFTRKIDGDLDCVYYKYEVDNIFHIVDPFCKACSVNSLKSCVIDMSSTNPQGFCGENYFTKKINEAIIYELSVNDYTSDISSGVKNNLRGKFLGLCDENCVSGISHLLDLGITHVQLMPVFDFVGVDERCARKFDDNNYNWGYNPENFNCIEGSYSTIPENPKNRIYEFKKMVQKLHENGIGVIMDVVYNHTYRSNDHPFNLIYKNFYRRDNCGKFSNGSGVGSELNTEDEFVRDFIVDSLLFYQKEYHIDGFRFDLMKLIDSQTVDKIVARLRENNENTIIYGEPWMANKSVLDKSSETTFGKQKGKHFAFFNPFFRDAIKGDNDGMVNGFVQCEVYKNELETGICGSIYYDDTHKGFCKNADETINYFNSHDNLILQDKLVLTNDDTKTSTKLCFDLILLSLGIPFFHCGNEFLRNKLLNKNTYNLPISVNAVDWRLKDKNIEIYHYVKSLIGFRKSHSEFKIVDANEIRDRVKFYDVNDFCICFSIKNKEGYLLIFINSADEFEFDLNEYFVGYKKCSKIFEDGLIDLEQFESVVLIDKRKSGVYSICM